MKLNQKQRDALSEVFTTVRKAFLMCESVTQDEQEKLKYKRFQELAFEIFMSAQDLETTSQDIAEKMLDFAKNMTNESDV